MVRRVFAAIISAVQDAVLVKICESTDMRIVSENLESKALVRWVEMEHGRELLIAHVPNNTPTTPEVTGYLHSMGVRRGVPDYIVVHRKTHRVVFIELKKRRRGVRSKEQKIWIAALGKRARFCNGWHEAAEFIREKLL